MSFLRSIFETFSTRQKLTSIGLKQPAGDAKQIPRVPEPTRNRVFQLCAEIFSNERSPNHGYRAALGENLLPQFWIGIHRILTFRHGTPVLLKSNESNLRTDKFPALDSIGFLLSCSPEEFLDFVEYIFNDELWPGVQYDRGQVVEDINQILRFGDLPYHLTSFVYETGKEIYHGREVDVRRLVSKPQIIVRENEVLHTLVTEPALKLLQNNEYATANKEFLSALEDYRKNDFADCLTKCGSALESVLKIICKRRGWTFNATDTAQPLIRTFIKETGKDPYFESILMSSAVLRNKLSAAHGAGLAPKVVSRATALYMLNLTASTMVFVAQEAGEL